MNVREVCTVLESIAPVARAQAWDNVGLLIGDPADRVTHLMLCIDLTQAVLDEARAAKATLVMAYHPPIFKPIATLTAGGVPYQAARAGVSVYSMHTALDVAQGGTNDVLADVVGLASRRPLDSAPEPERVKIVVFVPEQAAGIVANAAYQAGAGEIGLYSRCSFSSAGVGTFRPGALASPAIGSADQDESVAERRVEMIAPASRAAGIVRAIRQAHPYEEAAVDVLPVQTFAGDAGMGRVGPLEKPTTVGGLIPRIKRRLGVKRVWVTGGEAVKSREITTVAVAAGSAGSCWRDAAAAGAEFYLTGEMRHHDALAATAAGLTVVCVGHSHSERITLSTVADRLAGALPGLLISQSESDVDPFSTV
jgi:dinuclear metal center YbgI/SA1388 family protein